MFQIVIFYVKKNYLLPKGYLNRIYKRYLLTFKNKNISNEGHSYYKLNIFTQNQMHINIWNSSAVNNNL